MEQQFEEASVQAVARIEPAEVDDAENQFAKQRADVKSPAFGREGRGGREVEGTARDFAPHVDGMGGAGGNENGFAGRDDPGRPATLDRHGSAECAE
jgi:hypothetical protein